MSAKMRLGSAHIQLRFSSQAFPCTLGTARSMVQANMNPTLTFRIQCSELHCGDKTADTQRTSIPFVASQVSTDSRQPCRQTCSNAALRVLPANGPAHQSRQASVASVRTLSSKLSKEARNGLSRKVFRSKTRASSARNTKSLEENTKPVVCAECLRSAKNHWAAICEIPTKTQGTWVGHIEAPCASCTTRALGHVEHECWFKHQGTFQPY